MSNVHIVFVLKRRHGRATLAKKIPAFEEFIVEETLFHMIFHKNTRVKEKFKNSSSYPGVNFLPGIK